MCYGCGSVWSWAAVANRVTAAFGVFWPSRSPHLLSCVRVQKSSEVVKLEDACEPLERSDAESGFSAFDAHEVTGIDPGAPRGLA